MKNERLKNLIFVSGDMHPNGVPNFFSFLLLTPETLFEYILNFGVTCHEK